MKPYFETELGKLYYGDCLEILPCLGDFDVIFSDPPFFMPASHYQSRVSWGRSWADLSILGQYFFDLVGVYKDHMKDLGHLFVFCHDESYPVFYPALYGLWTFTAGMVWDKTRIGLGKIFRHQFELILWASNSGAWVNNDGKAHSDILRHPPTLSAKRIHPVEKPITLYQELLTVCCPKDGIVLDGYLGSGTSALACESLNIKWIGIELEEKYCEATAKRMENEGKQLKLFGPNQSLETDGQKDGHRSD